MSYLWVINTTVVTNKNLGPSPKKLSRFPRLLIMLQWHNVSGLDEAGFFRWEVLIRGVHMLQVQVQEAWVTGFTSGFISPEYHFNFPIGTCSSAGLLVLMCQELMAALVGRH